jgi:hypothetical protein
MPAFKACIQRLQVVCNCDTAEGIFGAIELATVMDWRQVLKIAFWLVHSDHQLWCTHLWSKYVCPGRTFCRSRVRTIIHIGDAPCHGNQYHNMIDDHYPRGDPEKRCLEDMLNVLRVNCRVGGKGGSVVQQRKPERFHLLLCSQWAHVAQAHIDKAGMTQN